MTYDWAFLPMSESTSIVDDPVALRARLEEDGYLYLPKLLDRDDVLAVRRDVLRALGEAGWTDPEALPMAGRVGIEPAREGDPAFFDALDRVQKLESFHTLAHQPALVAAMRAALGESAFPHPLKIARLVFPDFEAISTPPHQDYPNNQGTEKLTATWIPLGDMAAELGGLAILRGSHKWGPLPLTNHLGAGNRCAMLPPEMLEECRWVTTRFEAGDVLVFPSLTVHAALHNLSGMFFRLSIDFRWQLEGEALTAGCLEPHFGRLSWDEIYEQWRSDEFQYYWRDLDYDVVPFQELEIVETLSEDELIAEFLQQQARTAARQGQRPPVTS
ncbi:MAG: phytanoyl-CoA dioxygenase family protein [Acidimicrobiales bacterium]|nr:phytanoyl-CoA dioxygenase family protein [Acidimicrobiales bacterium]